METIICEICIIPFEVKNYRKTKARFCSVVCYGIHQSTSRIGIGRKRIIVQCDTCGDDIEKQPSAIKDTNFCDRKCWVEWRSSGTWSGENNPAWLGGHSQYRGPDWKSQRAKSLKRDNNTCQHCDVTGITLHTHHIKPYHLFDNYLEANSLDNLISLCPICHAAAETLFWKQHPELVSKRKIPTALPVKNCTKCNKNFVSRSPATRFCDHCCTFICTNCHNPFYSRKTSDRTPKYCNKACRNEHIKSHKMSRRKSSV